MGSTDVTSSIEKAPTRKTSFVGHDSSWLSSSFRHGRLQEPVEEWKVSSSGHIFEASLSQKGSGGVGWRIRVGAQADDGACDGACGAALIREFSLEANSFWGDVARYTAKSREGM